MDINPLTADLTSINISSSSSSSILGRGGGGGGSGDDDGGIYHSGDGSGGVSDSVSVNLTGTLDSLVVVLALFSLFTVLINLVLGLLLFWSRANHAISFLLATGNFIIANFFYGCVALPLQAQLLSTGNRWNYSHSSCLTLMTLTDIFEDASTLSLAMINLDQVVSITKQQRWYNSRGYKKMMLVVGGAGTWAFPTAVELYLHVEDWYSMGDVLIHLSDVCVSITTKNLKIYRLAFTTCLSLPILGFFVFLHYVKLSKIHISTLHGFDKLVDMIPSVLMLDIAIIITRFFSGSLLIACLVFSAGGQLLTRNPFPTSLYISALWMKRASFGVPMLLLLASKTVRNSVKQLIHGDRTYIVPSTSDSQMDDINTD